jgi:hypothetical protein
MATPRGKVKAAATSATDMMTGMGNSLRFLGMIAVLGAALHGRMAASVAASGRVIGMAQASDSIELGVGASARVSDLTIVFEQVESDGRCPRGATCIWEGDAVVRLTAGKPGQGERATLRLHTHASGAREAQHAGKVVRLVELHPYPTVDRPVDPKEYRVRLTVTQSGGAHVR